MFEEIINGVVVLVDVVIGFVFIVEKIYVKDVFFELLNVLIIFNDQVQLELQLNLNQQVQCLGENVFEVVLVVILICQVGECIVYVVEVKQVGVFGLVGLDLQLIDVLFGIQCLNILFLYVCQLISDLIQVGGFLLFFLQLINFEGLYVEILCQCQEQGDVLLLVDFELVGNV